MRFHKAVAGSLAMLLALSPCAPAAAGVGKTCLKNEPDRGIAGVNVADVPPAYRESPTMDFPL